MIIVIKQSIHVVKFVSKVENCYLKSLCKSYISSNAGSSMLIFVNVASVVLVMSIIIADLVLTEHSDSKGRAVTRFFFGIYICAETEEL